MSDFIHLHTHSHYSLLNALPKIKELVSEAKKNNMDALALTDDCNLYGAVEFFSACEKEGIQPIIGIDAYMALRTRHDKEAGLDKGWRRLVLLAKNNNGYRNLIKLVTCGYLEGFYYKPRIDKECLEKYSKDLICISPSFSGDIAVAVKNRDEEKAIELIGWYKKTFGEDNFFLEITHHPEIEGHQEKMDNLIKLARKTNTHIVGAHDVYYLKSEDRSARETLVSIQSHNPNRGDGEEDFSFISQEQAKKYFKDLPDALENTSKIKKMCEWHLTLGEWKFPNYIIESGRSPDEELRHLAYEQGLKFRNMELTDEVRERMDYELKVIKDKGYCAYFLAVADLLRFARENKILSNTRGSAAGSLISYLLGITIVDPIKLKLPFERFLNPGRPSAPDVDMDFADERRDEVIEYARQKYGEEHVAQIGTFGTMMARGSVRDTARALGHSYNTGDKIAKIIPMGSQGFPMTIERALEESTELQELYDKDADTKEIIDMAKKIEGCARHIGVHAAGVVISPDPLTDDVPLQHDPKGGEKLITQYDMYSVGEDGIGLLKFDFLGLKNLTIMGNTISLLKKIYDIEVDIDQVPLNDKKTYEMIARGETVATFQLNGSGMIRFLKELKPTNILDINAMVALYRPGPMAFIPDYIERKYNPQLVKYIDDRFKEILEPTFGILIYQDDIMLVAVNIAGYTWGEADKFRKAMGKKIPELMAEQKEKFFKGCIEHGKLSKAQVEDLWKQIETFAAYGFNKAHAASYGRVAYLTSYLKANYPTVYMTAVLTSDQGDVDKISEMVSECKKMKIDVLAPDLNESFGNFTVVEEGKIRFGLYTIKNFGQGIADSIIEERQKNGKFKSLADFLNRVNDKNLNKKSLESLIKAGALDEFGERNEMLFNLEHLLHYNKEQMEQGQNQDSLFGNVEMPGLTLEKTEPATVEQKLAWEKELLGLYVSGHPLDKFKEKLDGRKATISNIKKEAREGTIITVVGLISNIKELLTKKGDKMLFMKIEDYSGEIETVVFPRILEEFKDVLVEENCIVLKGKMSRRNDEPGLIVEKVRICD